MAVNIAPFFDAIIIRSSYQPTIPVRAYDTFYAGKAVAAEETKPYATSDHRVPITVSEFHRSVPISRRPSV